MRTTPQITTKEVATAFVAEMSDNDIKSFTIDGWIEGIRNCESTTDDYESEGDDLAYAIAELVADRRVISAF